MHQFCFSAGRVSVAQRRHKAEVCTLGAASTRASDGRKIRARSSRDGSACETDRTVSAGPMHMSTSDRQGTLEEQPAGLAAPISPRRSDSNAAGSHDTVREPGMRQQSAPRQSRREWLLAGASGVIGSSVSSRADAASSTTAEPRRATEAAGSTGQAAAQETGITALRNPGIYR